MHAGNCKQEVIVQSKNDNYINNMTYNKYNIPYSTTVVKKTLFHIGSPEHLDMIRRICTGMYEMGNTQNHRVGVQMWTYI